MIRGRVAATPRLPRGHSAEDTGAGLLAFDGLIVDASARGPMHDGEVRHPRATWLLDAFEA